MIYPLILVLVAAKVTSVVGVFYFDALVGMIAWRWVAGEFYVWNYQKALNRREEHGGPPRNLFVFDADAQGFTFFIVMFVFLVWIFSWLF